MTISKSEFLDPALYPGQMNRYEVFEGRKEQPQVDDGVAPSSLDRVQPGPAAEVTGYGDGEGVA
jgi:hypothetical protein